MMLVIKGPPGRLKWIGAFCRQKGGEDALDHRFEFLHSLVVGIFGCRYEWWNHSDPAGRCHHRRADPHYSGTEMIGVIWTLAPEGEIFGKEVVNRSRKILPKFRIPSVRYNENNVGEKGGI